MKTTKVLLLGAVVTAFTFSAFAQSGAAARLLSRNDPKTLIYDNTTTTIVYRDNSSALLSPRAQANQIRHVVGTNNDVNPALLCQKTMSGSPKAVAECSSHTTMPGCKPMTVAPLK